jgi:hypothetical protein
MGILTPMRMAIGVKLIQFMPCSKNQFAMHQNRPYNPNEEQPGYLVRYPDAHGSFENAYESWSPKDVFEAAYLPLEGDGTKITEAVVNDFMGEPHWDRISEKTTLVKVMPKTGFEQYEVSSCVDPANYDHKIGTECATRRIRDRMWGYLGFVLQWARYGLCGRDLSRDQADHIADWNECGPTQGCDEVQCRGSMPPGVVIDEAAGSSIPQQ